VIGAGGESGLQIMKFWSAGENFVLLGENLVEYW
jgi:hypothetical protein